MFEEGDPVFYKGIPKLPEDPIEYRAFIIRVDAPILHDSRRYTRYMIRLAPKQEQPNGQYPVYNSLANRIQYMHHYGQSKNEGDINNVQASELRPSDDTFDPIEEEPTNRITKISERSYYRFFGKNIEKNAAINEIEEDMKNIKDECAEKLDTELRRLNAELSLQYSLKYGKKRMTRSGGKKNKRKKNKRTKNKRTKNKRMKNKK